MQIDIITQNATVLKAGETKVTTIANNENIIDCTIVIKNGVTEKTYRLVACDKQGEIKGRLER